MSYVYCRCKHKIGHGPLANMTDDSYYELRKYMNDLEINTLIVI